MLIMDSKSKLLEERSRDFRTRLEQAQERNGYVGAVFSLQHLTFHPFEIALRDADPIARGKESGGV